MATYYVATNGSNQGDGSADSPWRTINHAVNTQLRPGDEIVVRAGTYNEAITMSRGGSAAGNVTLRAEEPGEVFIRPPSTAWNAITVVDDYITIEGLNIANARGDGIEANGVHHIEILNNVAHGNGESGIQFNYSEFILIEGNETYGNAASGWFSGISVYQNRNITGDTSTPGFRTIVRDNISYDNITERGEHTDGNGIIIDDFQSTQTSGFPNYTFPTLVENNLVYENGGKGIQLAWSDYVTVRNNTSYHNNQDLQNPGTWRGEISNAQSSNNTIVNNIAVADPSVNRNNTAIDNTSYGGYSNDNVVWKNNLTFNGTTGQASVRTDGNNNNLRPSDGNLLGVDPRFVDPRNDDFTLRSDSPAVDAGTSSIGLPDSDLVGGDRTVGQVDIGAYELGGGSGGGSTPPANTAPNARNDSGFSTEAGDVISIAPSSLLANDTDADGDDLSIISVGQATGGSVTIGGAGNINFRPNSSFEGDARFSYTISDGNGGRDSANVTVNVNASAPTPPPPTPDQDSNIVVRWNAGTDTIAAIDGGPAWVADSGAVVGSARAATHNIGTSGRLDGSVPDTTPVGIFSQELWGNSASAGMGLEFGDGALENGTYAVRLFLGNGFSGTNDAGERVFDVSIDGAVFLDDIDLSGTLGHQVGGMYEWQGNVRDGTIDIDFDHIVENPLVNGVEILRLDADPDPTPPPAPSNADPKAIDDAGLKTDFQTPLVIPARNLLSNDTDSDGDTLTIIRVGGATNGSVRLDGDPVFTPAQGFSGQASFNYTVSDGNGGTDQGRVTIDVGASPADGSDTDGETFSLWDDRDTPDVLSDPDNVPIELGLRFVADQDAELEALRLYVSSQNDGVESISLRSSNGNLIASQDVSGFSRAGWQEVAFDTPVTLQAGQAYTASYFTTSGRYSVSENFFTSGFDAGPVSINANAGVYAYAPQSTAPTNTYNASNYWIDLVLDLDGEANDSPASATRPASTESDDLIGEAGVIKIDQNSANTWHKVQFTEALDDPSVVMSPMSTNGSAPFAMRVKNVTDTGFEFQMDEWDYLNGAHVAETLGWVAVENGVHTLSDGRTIAAGSTAVGEDAVDVSFVRNAFDDAPSVFAQVVTNKTKFAVNERIDDVGANGLTVLLEQQEATVGKISRETVDIIAVEQGSGGSGVPLAGATPKNVNENGRTISFNDSFGSDGFVFLTDMQTRAGADPATVQTTELTAEGATIRIAEEQSKDTETAHASESVAYVGIDIGQIYGLEASDLLIA